MFTLEGSTNYAVWDPEVSDMVTVHTSKNTLKRVLHIPAESRRLDAERHVEEKLGLRIREVWKRVTQYDA